MPEQTYSLIYFNRNSMKQQNYENTREGKIRPYGMFKRCLSSFVKFIKFIIKMTGKSDMRQSFNSYA